MDQPPSQLILPDDIHLHVDKSFRGGDLFEEHLEELVAVIEVAHLVIHGDEAAVGVEQHTCQLQVLVQCALVAL